MLDVGALLFAGRDIVNHNMYFRNTIPPTTNCDVLGLVTCLVCSLLFFFISERQQIRQDTGAYLLGYNLAALIHEKMFNSITG